MKKLVWTLLGMTMALGASSTAHARGGGGGLGSGILLDLNLFYYNYQDSTANTGGSASNTGDTTTIYDIKVGDLMASGLYIGGIYTSRSNNVLNASGTSGSAYGASVGYYGGSGFYIVGHYLLSATYGTESKGSGIQADAGYASALDNNVVVGVELTYRMMTYTKDSANASLSSDKVTETMPMLTIGYLF